MSYEGRPFEPSLHEIETEAEKLETLIRQHVIPRSFVVLDGREFHDNISDEEAETKFFIESEQVTHYDISTNEVEKREYVQTLGVVTPENETNLVRIKIGKMPYRKKEKLVKANVSSNSILKILSEEKLKECDFSNNLELGKLSILACNQSLSDKDLTEDDIDNIIDSISTRHGSGTIPDKSKFTHFVPGQNFIEVDTHLAVPRNTFRKVRSYEMEIADFPIIYTDPTTRKIVFPRNKFKGWKATKKARKLLEENIFG